MTLMGFQKTNQYVGVEGQMTSVFVVLFGSVVVLMVSNLVIAWLLGLLTLDTGGHNQGVRTHKSRVFQVLWKKIRKKLGIQHKPEVLEGEWRNGYQICVQRGSDCHQIGKQRTFKHQISVHLDLS